MKKIAAILFTVASLAAPAAAVTFTDLPQDHWAHDAVYGIVRYGVTQGYPDGTFRGTRTINRYELSVFLYNLIQSVESRIQQTGTTGRSGEVSNKAIEELRAEIDNLRIELAALRTSQPAAKAAPGKGFKADFVYGARARITNVLTEPDEGKLYENRLVAKAEKQLGDKSAVYVKYDSHWVDVTTDDLLKNLDRIDAKFTTALDLGLESPLNVILTTGPGANIDRYEHYDDQIALSTAISGIGILYANQVNYNALELSYSIPDFGVGAYDTSLLFELYNNAVSPFSNDTSKVGKAYLDISSTPVKNVWLGANFGVKVADPDDSSTPTAFNFRSKIGDISRTGTSVFLNFIKTEAGFYKDPSTETPYRQLLDNSIFVANNAAVYEIQINQAFSPTVAGYILYNLKANNWADNAVNTVQLEIANTFSPSAKWFANYLFQTNPTDSALNQDYIRTGMYIYF